MAGGCAVAFFWTFFPYPITASSTLRKQLGESLYLLANFYSCVHTTIRMQVEGAGGSPEDKKSPCRRLEKARDQILAKELALFAQLRQHSSSTIYEPTLGGKFPKGQYDVIINEVQKSVACFQISEALPNMTLVYSTTCRSLRMLLETMAKVGRHQANANGPTTLLGCSAQYTLHHKRSRR